MQIRKACMRKASLDTCPRDIHGEVREAFQGRHLHPTPKHALSTECSRELLRPSSRFHIGGPHPLLPTRKY